MAGKPEGIAVDNTMKKIIILIILATILVIGATIFISRKNNKPIVPDTGAKKMKNVAPLGNGVVNVDITSSGFSPSSQEVKQGDKVIWKNNTKLAVEIVQDESPNSTLPKPNPENIIPGGTSRLVFTVVGTYKYHIKANPSQTGTITVSP